MNIIVTQDDTAIYYEIKGEGIPLILLPGQYMNTTMYDALEPELLKKFQLISIDPRGHGYSDKPLHITMDGYVQDVLTVMDELLIDDAMVLGYGLGGMIAVHAAATTDRFTALCLVSTGIEPVNKMENAFFHRYASIVRTMTQQERQKMMHNLIYHQVKSVNKWQKGLRDILSGMTTNEMDAVNHSTDGCDILQEGAALNIPTLIISGKEDPLVGPTASEALHAAVPDSTLLIYDESGHAPLIEEKERFLKDMTQFFTKNLEKVN